MFKVSFEDNGLLQRLSAVAMRATEIPKSVWQEIGNVIIEDELLAFDVGGIPVAWKPNKSGKPLLGGRGGKLAQSIHVEEIGENYVTVSSASKTELPYVMIHQFGGEIVQQVSPKQIAFFWAKYYETKEDMWKWAAIKFRNARFGKGEAFLHIHIEARRWFRLYDSSTDKILELLGKYIMTGQQSPITIL